MQKAAICGLNSIEINNNVMLVAPPTPNAYQNRSHCFSGEVEPYSAPHYLPSSVGLLGLGIRSRTGKDSAS